MKILFKTVSLFILFGWLNTSLADFLAAPCAGDAPLTVNLNASDSYDPDNNIVSYDWLVSNGQTAKGRNISLHFSRPGNYGVTLTVTDRNGAKDQLTETIAICGDKSDAPIAKIAAIPTNTGPAPLKVTFDATQSKTKEGQWYEYKWLSTDGQIVFGKTVDLIFPQEGDYTMTLIVKNSEGETALDTKEIIVTAPVTHAPFASFSLTPNYGPIPLKITLDASDSSDPDGEIGETLDYEWQIVKEGSNEVFAEEGKIVQLTLENEGSYTVKLTVIDNDGLQTTATDTVTAFIGQNDIAELEIVDLKDFYIVGDQLTITLKENLNIAERNTPVDLWVKIKFPNQDIYYYSDKLNKYDKNPQAYDTNLTVSDIEHRLFDMEVPPGAVGEYQLSAVYAQQEANDPFKNPQERRSEVLVVETYLRNE